MVVLVRRRAVVQQRHRLLRLKRLPVAWGGVFVAVGKAGAAPTCQLATRPAHHHDHYLQNNKARSLRHTHLYLSSDTYSHCSLSFRVSLSFSLILIPPALPSPTTTRFAVSFPSKVLYTLFLSCRCLVLILLNQPSLFCSV